MTAHDRKRARSITFGMRPEVRRELEQDIAKAYAAGRTIKSIERAHRVSCGFIRSVLRKQGVTLRPRGKPLGSPQSGGVKAMPTKARTLHGQPSDDCYLHDKKLCEGSVRPWEAGGHLLCQKHRQILHAIATRKRRQNTARKAA